MSIKLFYVVWRTLIHLQSGVHQLYWICTHLNSSIRREGEKSEGILGVIMKGFTPCLQGMGLCN